MATIAPARNAGFSFVTTIHNDTYPTISPLKIDLVGKHVLISGASDTVGRTTAVSYARAGASSICICARSSLESLESELLAAAEAADRPRPEILALEVDVKDGDSVAACCRAVTDVFGRLDILVNGSVGGTNNMTSAFLPLLLIGGDGDRTIVGLTSLGAHIFLPGAPAYQGPKSNTMKLNGEVMAQYGRFGVIAYTLHPGLSSPAPMPGAPAPAPIDKPELAADTIVYLTSKRRKWLADRYVSCTWDMEEFCVRKGEIVAKDWLARKKGRAE